MDLMRWDAQTLDLEDGATLPGLPTIRGLLRSVQVPEFPGVTFHEVRAKSVLNHVPGESAMPFPWTINPYRGCVHACVYCVEGDTRILMADGSQRRIADLRVGDRIVGTEERGTYRHYVTTEVLAHWSTVKPAYRVTLADGTEVVASGDHRFLSAAGWKHVMDEPSAEIPRPHLSADDALLGFGISQAVPGDGDLASTNPALSITSVKSLDVELPMFDITTGTGDFLANGVISHNCFARRTHEWLEFDSGHDFDSQIVVKTNLVDVLRKELGRPSWKREHVALGTNTDPYQRAEGRYQLMPGIIRALADSGTPFSILTKGTLARRDIPLLVEAARRVPVGFGVSLAVWDDELHAALEPGVPSPKARLELVRALTDAGLPCGVFLAPVLPGLTDSVEHLDRAIGSVAAVGATGITVIPLHLRPGAREWFMAWLRDAHPELVPRYEQLYGRRAYVPAEYRQWLSLQVTPLLAKHGLDRQSGGTARGATDAIATGVPGDEEVGFPEGSLPSSGLPVRRASNDERSGLSIPEPEQLTLL